MNKDYELQKSQGYKNQLSMSFDPSKPQFTPDDTEMKALFDTFQKNDRVDLDEFLSILKDTSKNCYIHIYSPLSIMKF